MPAHQERPPRAGNKSAFYATLLCAGQGEAQRKTGCEELATNERIKSLLFPAVSPACRGERTCTKRDGLRPEQSTRSFLGSSQVNKAKGETGAVCARRARTRRTCLGADAPKGLSAGTGSGGSSACGTSSKMMRRHVPEKVIGKIIESPGGATGSEPTAQKNA